MSERSAVLPLESFLHPRSQLSEVSIPVLTSEINHCFPGSEPWELDFQRRIAPSRPSRLSGGGQFPRCTRVEVEMDTKLGRLVCGDSHRDFLTSPIAVSPVNHSLSARRQS